MTKTELMRNVNAAIDKRASEIIGLGETIRRHPELGFKEFKTARLVEDTMRGMGLSPKGGLAITGVRADAHILLFRQFDGALHDLRVAAVKAARDICRRDVRHQRFIIPQCVNAVTLANIRI